MPALLTHYKFGQDLLNNLSKDLQNEIKSNINYYNMFNQGFDNLFYYPIHWSQYKKFAIKAHKKNIPEFFSNMIDYLVTNKLTNQSDLTNMVYGFINHYTVDTIIHPFINYQVKNLNIPHTRIEFMIDSQILKNYSDPKIYKTIIPKLKFSKNLLNLIDYTFLKTYDKNNIGKIFNRSHNNDYYVYRYFVNDNSGKKTNFYKTIDNIFKFKNFKLGESTFYIKNFDESILNNDKNKWHHPKNEQEIYSYSYEELYDYCIIICTKLNNLAYKVLHMNEKPDLLIDLISKINIKNIQLFLDL